MTKLWKNNLGKIRKEHNKYRSYGTYNPNSTKVEHRVKQNKTECDNWLILFDINSFKNNTETIYLMFDLIYVLDCCEYTGLLQTSRGKSCVLLQKHLFGTQVNRFIGNRCIMIERFSGS